MAGGAGQANLYELIHGLIEALNEVRALHPAVPKNCNALVLVLLGCYRHPSLPTLPGGLVLS